MKKSDLRNIIKEEIKSILEAEDPINVGLKKAMGFTPPTDGNRNRLKGKEYTFDYAFFINADDYDNDVITVTASSEEEAYKIARAELKSRKRPIKGGLTLRKN